MEVSFILDTGLRLLLLNTGIHSLASFLRIPQKLGNLYQISSYEFRGWKDCIVFSINSRKRKKNQVDSIVTLLLLMMISINQQKRKIIRDTFKKNIRPKSSGDSLW